MCMKDIETSEGWRNQVKIILMRGGGVSSPSVALPITCLGGGPYYIGIIANAAQCSRVTFLKERKHVIFSWIWITMASLSLLIGNNWWVMQLKLIAPNRI